MPRPRRAPQRSCPVAACATTQPAEIPTSCQAGLSPSQPSGGFRDRPRDPDRQALPTHLAQHHEPPARAIRADNVEQLVVVEQHRRIIPGIENAIIDTPPAGPCASTSAASTTTRLPACSISNSRHSVITHRLSRPEGLPPTSSRRRPDRASVELREGFRSSPASRSRQPSSIETGQAARSGRRAAISARVSSASSVNRHAARQPPSGPRSTPVTSTSPWMPTAS